MCRMRPGNLYEKFTVKVFQFSHMCRMRLPAQTKDGRWSTISILAYVQNATAAYRMLWPKLRISILAYVQNATKLHRIS